jgi:hypothetical protein
METSVSRYDFAAITGTETTEEGYLKVWAKAARTGLQAYNRADGSRVMEYRPPEEVSSPDSLNTFGMKPATWGHPPSLLNTENTKQYQIGYTGSQVRYNDGFVEVAIVLTDKDSIEKVQRGDAREVSAGYKVDFDPTPGITEDGQKYIGIQRKIRVNHIAVVPRGRAGPEVRLLMDRMDAADAVSSDFEQSESQPTQPQLSKPMASIKLDGLELDLPVEAASAIQSHLRDLERRLDATEAERTSLSERCDSLAAEIENLAYEKEQAEEATSKLQTKLDAAPSEARLDQAQIDELVTARLDTLRHLAPAFEDDFKFDGIDDESLFRQAFTNLTGSEPREDAAPAYINGVVDGLLSRLDEEESEEEVAEEPAAVEEAPRADSTLDLREALSSTQRPSDVSATSAYRARMSDAWKQPLTASK